MPWLLLYIWLPFLLIFSAYVHLLLIGYYSVPYPEVSNLLIGTASLLGPCKTSYLCDGLVSLLICVISLRLLEHKRTGKEVVVKHCPFCHATHGRADNLWKLYIEVRA